MPQLRRVAFHSGTFWYLRCPYHAKVIKTLEQSSRTMVSMMFSLSHSQVGGRFKRGAADAADHSGAITADQRIGDLAGAVRAIESVRWLRWICGLRHRLRKNVCVNGRKNVCANACAKNCLSKIERLNVPM